MWNCGSALSYNRNNVEYMYVLVFTIFPYIGGSEDQDRKETRWEIQTRKRRYKEWKERVVYGQKTETVQNTIDRTENGNGS